MKETKFVLSSSELSKEFGIPTYTINYCIRTGKLPKGSYVKSTSKFNSTYIFTQEGVDALLNYQNRKNK